MPIPTTRTTGTTNGSSHDTGRNSRVGHRPPLLSSTSEASVLNTPRTATLGPLLRGASGYASAQPAHAGPLKWRDGQQREYVELLEARASRVKSTGGSFSMAGGKSPNAGISLHSPSRVVPPTLTHSSSFAHGSTWNGNLTPVNKLHLMGGALDANFTVEDPSTGQVLPPPPPHIPRPPSPPSSLGRG